jgi:hypothetical protein
MVRAGQAGRDGWLEAMTQDSALLGKSEIVDAFWMPGQLGRSGAAPLQGNRDKVNRNKLNHAYRGAPALRM